MIGVRSHRVTESGGIKRRRKEEKRREEKKVIGFLLGTTVRNGKFYRDCLWSGKTS
jgi:hypothetical protein